MKTNLYKELGKLREIMHILDKELRLFYAEGLRITEHGEEDALGVAYSQTAGLTDACAALLNITIAAKTSVAQTQLAAALPARLRNFDRQGRLLPASEPPKLALSLCSSTAPPQDPPSLETPAVSEN